MKASQLCFPIFAFFTVLLFCNMSRANTVLLSKTEQAIIPIAAFSAGPYTAELKSSINAGLNAGLTVNQIKEIFIQTYAYSGFPRSLNALTLLKETLDDRMMKGVKDEIGDMPNTKNQEVTTLSELENQGNRIRNELVGRDLTQNSSPYAQIAPEIDQFLKTHLFGAIFSRDTLNYKQRELVTISLLATQEGLESQLGSHLIISHNIGWSWDALSLVATILETQVNTVSAQRMKRQLEKFKE